MQGPWKEKAVAMAQNKISTGLHNSEWIKSVMAGIEEDYCQLSDVTKADWLACTEIVELKKGHELMAAGQFSTILYYVIQGGIKVYYLKNGKKITDWFSFERDFVCSVCSFFTNTPSDHYIELLEDSVLMTTSRADLLRLFEKHHDFERLGRISTTKTLVESQDRLASLQFESAHQKYLNLLAVHPRIELRASAGDIASYLGITLETFSRIRSKR